jgi:hypothetical protein
MTVGLYAVDLSELPEADQLRIRAFIRHRRHNDSNYTTEHSWVGQRIWRPVHVVSFRGKLIKEPFDDLLIQDSLTKSEVRPKSVKVLRTRKRLSDESWIARDADESGLVCLCFEPIPAEWTYFEIQKGHFLETSVVVRPVVGEKSELLAKF